MEDFKKKLRTRIIICLIGAAVAAAVFIVLRLTVYSEDSFVYYYSGGMCYGMTTALFAKAVRFAITLKDPDGLQKLYTTETDERDIFILEKASRASFFTSVFIIALSSAVTAFFSELLAKALVIVLAVMVLTKLFFVLYYRKKY